MATLPLGVLAQFYNLPNDYSYSLLTQKQLAVVDSFNSHASIAPYNPFFSKKHSHVIDSHKVFKYITGDVAIDRLFFKHLIEIKSKENNDYYFTIDPILNFEGGKDTKDSLNRRLSVNTRGFYVTGQVGSNFYFETLFAENQGYFPDYITQFNNSNKVVPGQGRWKTFKNKGYDYAFSSGFISYQPIKQLNIQLGHGKQKIGNGYRSLLLSDNAFNYPFIRITSQWFKGRVQYMNTYAVMTNLTNGGVKTPPYTEQLFQKKAASFQYLSCNVSKRLNLSFFQGLIWEAADTKNQQHLSWEYFNPLLYTNMIPLGLANTNNLLIGGDINIKATNSVSFYGQWMVDDLKKNAEKWGYQIGLKYFDVLSLKNLFLQVEYNKVSEPTYTSPVLSSDQSYSHYNQNLAYTPNHGQEVVAITDYKYKRFFVNAKLNYQIQSFGGAESSVLNFYSAKVGYTINPSYNLNIYLGINQRNKDYTLTLQPNDKTNYIYIGLKTSLYNTYYDF